QQPAGSGARHTQARVTAGFFVLLVRHGLAVNVRAAFENDPPALDFVWPGFLAGTVGALVAPGGVGRSFWALSDAARLIHQRLCAWIDPGKSGRVDIDTLCGYVWPDAAVNANTVKTQRQTVRRALAELDALGWRVESYTKDKWEISRPKLTEPRLGR